MQVAGRTQTLLSANLIVLVILRHSQIRVQNLHSNLTPELHSHWLSFIFFIPVHGPEKCDLHAGFRSHLSTCRPRITFIIKAYFVSEFIATTCGPPTCRAQLGFFLYHETGRHASVA